MVYTYTVKYLRVNVLIFGTLNVKVYELFDIIISD